VITKFYSRCQPSWIFKMAATMAILSSNYSSRPGRDLILVAIPMFWGIRNPVLITKFHFRCQPSWIFQMAAMMAILSSYYSSRPGRDLISVSILMFWGTRNALVMTKTHSKYQPSYIFKMNAIIAVFLQVMVLGCPSPPSTPVPPSWLKV